MATASKPSGASPRTLMWMMCTGLILTLNGADASSIEYDYASALDASFFFYEAQAAGPLPAWNRAGRWNVGGWRDASYLDDGKDIGKNLTGGWFDAGDHMKFQLPYGWAVSTLAWSVVEFPDAFASSGLFQVAKRNLLFAADYIVRSHINASDVPAENTYVAQVGDTDMDHARWCRPEQCPQVEGPYRPTWTTDSTRPGSDIVGEAVASLAGVALVLRHENPADPLADDLLRHARQLYDFAKAYPGTWEIPQGDYPYRYGNHKWEDDMLWAAAWMCRADQGTSYCTDAVSYWNAGSNMGIGWCRGMDWDNAFNEASVMMLGMTDRFNATFQQSLRTRLNWNLNRWHVSTLCTAPPPGTDANGDGLVDDGTVCYSPKGLVHEMQWGTLRVTANAAALKLVYAKFLAASQPAEAQTQRCWARRQVHLMLGDWGRSFVVGFGTNPPVRPHHSSSMCDPDFNIVCDGTTAALPRPNPSVLRGALVGGPRKDDSYDDNRMDYILNEVAVDYNAGFTVALAALLQLGASIPDWDAYCALSPPPPSPAPSSLPSPSAPPSPSRSPSSSPFPSPSPSPSSSSSPSSSPSPSPSPNPIPIPSPSPSPTTGICPAPRWECNGCDAKAAQRATCYSCVNVRQSQPWHCHACVGNATYSATQAESCLGCVSAGGDAWACQQYCTDLSSDPATLAVCTACTADPVMRAGSGPWRCGVCMDAAVVSIDTVGECMTCVRVGAQPYACLACAKKATAATREACLACVAVAIEPWTCL